MKSAYEIAMERMRKERGEPRSLTDEQRARIAKIEETARARVAEIQLGFDTKFRTADPKEHAELQRELAADLQRIEDTAEREKEAVWGEAG